MCVGEQVFETRCLNSLVKVFADEELKDHPYRRASALLNETFAFQVAYRQRGHLLKGIKVRIESDLSEIITIRSVGLVPSDLPCFHDHDERILRFQPGLYPDPLFPLDNDGLIGYPDQWRAVWVTVDIHQQVQPGLHPVRVIFETNAGERLGEEKFELDIISVPLPEQQIIYTQWFHSDCLATYYKAGIFSEMHWKLIDDYVHTAARHGVNMILTPLFTPPLDTEVGGERPTVQLVKVIKSGDDYQFHFDNLVRWIDMCRKRGIKYFEFSHLFTQWGALHAPKIVATEKESGELKKVFGWGTDAAGNDYKHFLSQFLPELVSFIKQHHLEKSVFFHISDEPHTEHLASYQNVSRLISEYLTEFPVIDALSDYSYYEKGLVKNPIPAIDHVDTFLDHQVPNLWTYYCCSQYKAVSNRFFNFPSVRNRIIGFQLYKFNITGFLHWGYNFWYSQFSRQAIDPFRITDAGGAFPSGDAFSVYPGEAGPIESIRLEVFYEALQDLRALNLLETLIGREQVITLLEKDLNAPLTFSEYPCDMAWFLNKREQINRKIADENA